MSATARLPEVMTLLRELIALPSVSCTHSALDQSNLAVIEKLADWCSHLGFQVEIMPIPGNPGKANLIAILGSGSGGLVLAGHTDTVAYDAARWRYDPFRLTQADNRLYGLGTSDMKSFFALALEAVRQTAGARFHQPLILIATADEETNMCGAQALVDACRPQARHAIIGEPTGLRPARLHKGMLMEAVRLIGLAGHSSDPSLGNNALEGMHRVMTALMAWRAELQQRYQNPLFQVTVPTLNFGHIHGGDNPNRICGDCELHLDLRPLPGMPLAELRAALHAQVEQAVADSGLQVVFTPLFSGIEAMETPAYAEIVRQAERLSGYAAEAVAFGTEGPYFNALGMETVILGPGDIAQAHQPDEFLSLDRLQPTITLLSQLIQHFCLQPQPHRTAG